MNDIWIDTPNGKIYGCTAGPMTGPLVLGIHGWSQRNGWHTWEPLIEPLGAAGLHVISVDMPGWGQSPKWERVAGKSAVVAILDSLQVPAARAIMGKSWGGGVAAAFAQTYPDRVEKLILTAPALRGEPADFERLSQPVLLAWAQDDPVIPHHHGESLAAALPHWRFISYETGGHSAAPSNATAFAPEAIAFLTDK